MDSNQTNLPWESPTLTVLGTVETLTAAGPSNGNDGAMVSGIA